MSIALDTLPQIVVLVVHDLNLGGFVTDYPLPDGPRTYRRLDEVAAEWCMSSDDPVAACAALKATYRLGSQQAVIALVAPGKGWRNIPL